MPRVRAWWPGAVAGLVAAALALAVGELVARLVEGESLVRAIGDVVVDSSPRAVSGAAIETFGTNNKPALLSGVVALSLLLGALLGPLAMRYRAIGVGRHGGLRPRRRPRGGARSVHLARAGLDHRGGRRRRRHRDAALAAADGERGRRRRPRRAS